jgi:hypothetical protein
VVKENAPFGDRGLQREQYRVFVSGTAEDQARVSREYSKSSRVSRKQELEHKKERPTPLGRTLMKWFQLFEIWTDTGDQIVDVDNPVDGNKATPVVRIL